MAEGKLTLANILRGYGLEPLLCVKCDKPIEIEYPDQPAPWKSAFCDETCRDAFMVIPLSSEAQDKIDLAMGRALRLLQKLERIGMRDVAKTLPMN